MKPMCVVIPIKILSIEGHTAKVDLGKGAEGIVDISLVEAEIGDYLIAQSGMAIRVVPEEEALESIEIFKKMEEMGIYD